MIKIFLTSVLLFSFFVNFSQHKFEREYRIKLSDAPQKSTQLITEWRFNNKVKWYAEESNEGKTFEAKTKFKKHLYSIEFSENGTLLDVEKKVSFLELKDNIQHKLKSEISKMFRKFRFKKIQIQYTAKESEIYAAIFKLNAYHSKVKIHYEIVLKGKKEKQYALYELTFDETGSFIKELKFEPNNSLNLEF